MLKASDTDALIIVYDGECPFCSQYVKMVRLREAAGPVRLVDARSDSPEVDMIRAAGLDLNEGMALIENGQIWHGDECIHRLALLSTSSTLFNRVNATVFRSRTLSRVLYPILRTGRNTVLAIMGRKRIPDKEA